MNKLISTLFAVAVLTLVGCNNSAFKGTYLEDSYVDRAPAGTIAEVTALYAQGDYQGAYDLGRPIALDRYHTDRYEAAYLAGLSAQSLGQLQQADRLLSRAKKSPDASLAVDAADALGLVYSQQSRYTQAQHNLLWAAERLQGERKAKAYFYAGIAQQKLGQWSQARTTLVIARGVTADAGFKTQISQQISVTGWTLQLGAFGDRDKARSLAESIAAKSRGLGLGLPRLVNGTTTSGEPVTFVHVGQFTSYQSATRYRDAIGTPGVIIRALTP